jgi:hypothetical protein
MLVPIVFFREGLVDGIVKVGVVTAIPNCGCGRGRGGRGLWWLWWWRIDVFQGRRSNVGFRRSWNREIKNMDQEFENSRVQESSVEQLNPSPQTPRLEKEKEKLETDLKITCPP